MNSAQKIDLSAIMKSHDTKISQKEVDNTIEESKIETKTESSKKDEPQAQGAHINLSAIKSAPTIKESPSTVLITEEKEEIKKDSTPKSLGSSEMKIKKESKDENNEKVENEKNNEIINNNESTEDEISKSILQNIELDSKADEEKNIKKTSISSKKGEIPDSNEVQDENTKSIISSGEELFVNYQSDFKKKETKIIDRIKKLKNMPKTNFVFLSVIMMIFVVGIGGLVYISPDNSTYKDMKASILNTYTSIIQKPLEPIVEIPVQPKDDIVTIDIPSEPENTPTIITDSGSTMETPEEKGEFDKGGYKIEVDVISGSGGIENYQYKGKIYTSKEQLNDAILIELPKLKKEKLETILLDIFSK